MDPGMKILLYSFALALLLFPRAQAQPDAVEQALTSLLIPKRLPELSGFRFMPSDLVKDPFITSYFRTKTGVGSVVDFSNTIRNFQGDTLGTFDGSMTFVSLGVEYQQAANDWLAFWGAVDIDARVGTSASSIFSQGISTVTGYAIGGMARVWHNDRMFLSGSLSYRGNSLTAVSPYQWAKSIIVDSAEVDNGQLVSDKSAGLGYAGVHFACDVNEWLGLTSVVSGGFGKAFGDEDKGLFSAGVTANVDFHQISPVPVGLLFGYQFNTMPNSGDNATDISAFSFGVGYTGHRDFNLILETTSVKFKLQDAETPVNTLTAAFKIRYYF
jgi:hypothetical protein